MNEDDEAFEEVGKEARKFAIVIVSLLVLIVLFAITPLAFSAPKAANAQEYFYMADMGNAARAMALENIPPISIAKVLRRMYKGPSVEEWIAAIVKSVYADRRGAGDFAIALYDACLKGGGDTAKFFGASV